ncbi:mannosyltransferase putative-domain-containing protein [Gorgonomyces haynaldii]|nr:mannosyltransferase putative-domain-containing protein [Gorgonomyces haynaldii]
MSVVFSRHHYFFYIISALFLGFFAAIEEKHKTGPILHFVTWCFVWLLSLLFFHSDEPFARETLLFAVTVGVYLFGYSRIDQRSRIGPIKSMPLWIPSLVFLSIFLTSQLPRSVEIPLVPEAHAVVYVKEPDEYYCNGILSVVAQQLPFHPIGLNEHLEPQYLSMNVTHVLTTLSRLKTHDYAIFSTEGVLYQQGSIDIVSKFQRLNASIVIAASKECIVVASCNCTQYPNSTLPRWAYGPGTVDTESGNTLSVPRYPHAGLFGGQIQALLGLFLQFNAADPENELTVHEHLAGAYVSKNYSIAVDFEMNLFATLSFSLNDLYLEDGLWKHKITHSIPSVIMFNEEAREMQPLYTKKSLFYHQTDMSHVRLPSETGTETFEWQCSSLNLAATKMERLMDGFGFEDIHGARELLHIYKLAFNIPKLAPHDHQESAKAIMSKIEQSTLLDWLENKSLSDLYKTFHGRGIVVPLHDKYFYHAYAALLSIRSVHKSNIPIYVMHLGETDLSQHYRQELVQNIEHLQIIDLWDIFPPHKVHFEGWSAKPAMLLAAPCLECILMDSDVWFTKNPVTLFDQSIYRNTGMLLFKDRTVIDGFHRQEWILSLIPSTFHHKIADYRMIKRGASHEAESGVVVINKAKRFVGMIGVAYLNTAPVVPESYRDFLGDKETFWQGMAMLEEDYGFDPQLPVAVGNYVDSEKEFCTSQMAHMDESGHISWVHGGLLTDKKSLTSELQNFSHYMLESERGYSFLSPSIICSKISETKAPIVLTDEVMDLQATRETQALWPQLSEQLQMESDLAFYKRISHLLDPKDPVQIAETIKFYNRTVEYTKKPGINPKIQQDCEQYLALVEKRLFPDWKVGPKDLSQSWKGKGLVLHCTGYECLESFDHLSQFSPVEVFSSDLTIINAFQERNVSAQYVEDQTIPKLLLLAKCSDCIYVTDTVKWFSDPLLLFSHPNYLESKSLLFHSVGIPRTDMLPKWMQISLISYIGRVQDYRMFNNKTATEVDPSVFVVDKRVHFAGLTLAAQVSDIFEASADMIWASLLLTNEKVSFHPAIPARLSNTTAFCDPSHAYFEESLLLAVNYDHQRSYMTEPADFQMINGTWCMAHGSVNTMQS